MGDRRDFFLSHAGADRAWAEWVAWQLTDAGYTVELDTWDCAAGQNFVLAMNDALARCDRIVALLSAAYFDRDRYTTGEWAVALLHVQGTGQGRPGPQDTLDRRRRVLGPDHPHTLTSANHLAEDLRLLGEAGDGS